MVSVRVVWQPRQISLPRSSRLPGMVFATESRVPTDAARMASLQTDLPREWNDVIRWLAALLQQPGRWPVHWGTTENENILWRTRNRYMQRCCEFARCFIAVSLIREIYCKSKNTLYAPKILSKLCSCIYEIQKFCAGKRKKIVLYFHILLKFIDFAGCPWTQFEDFCSPDALAPPILDNSWSTSCETRPLQSPGRPTPMVQPIPVSIHSGLLAVAPQTLG